MRELTIYLAAEKFKYDELIIHFESFESREVEINLELGENQVTQFFSTAAKVNLASGKIMELLSGVVGFKFPFEGSFKDRWAAAKGNCCSDSSPVKFIQFDIMGGPGGKK